MARIQVIVPTCEAGPHFKNFVAALREQENLQPSDVLVIDSSSMDETVQLARAAGFKVKIVARREFSHGGTRAAAVRETTADFLVFLTQDAILADRAAIKTLCATLEQDRQIGVVYGRQLPTDTTSIFGRYARLFNYPEVSRVNTVAAKQKFGLKAAFCSDSFAAYNRKLLLAIGNFLPVNFGEDTCAAAKLLLAGYKVAYCAEAQVYHAHSYGCWEEFQRYRVTGRFHREQAWLLENFGKAEGEGLRFVKSECHYLLAHGRWYLLPWAIFRNGCKYVGYFCGQHNL